MSTHTTQIGKWYRNSRWAKRAARQMQRHPLCVMCLADGIVTAARVADHVVPHKGDYNKFWYGTLQSLCKLHHDSHKAQLERHGFVTDIGNDGFPVDAKHPFNAMR